MLNELDKELEKRGLRFVRYADDCVIAVRSEASAKRVIYSITDWKERKLGLNVNAEKTHITRPSNLISDLDFIKIQRQRNGNANLSRIPYRNLKGRERSWQKEENQQRLR